jgi:hypothetical protein
MEGMVNFRFSGRTGFEMLNPPRYGVLISDCLGRDNWQITKPCHRILILPHR